MNTELFYYGLLQLGLSILLSVFVLYFTFSRVTRFFKRKHNFTFDNVAFAIFISGVIFSVGYLFEGINQPILMVIRFLKADPHFKGAVFFEAGKYVGLFLVIGLVFALSVSAIAVYFFTILTRLIDEFEELKNGNVAVGIILAAVIITVSFICRDSLVSILEAFIPYPASPNIQ
ncbi:MAG TPA: DUF350 domain-containing protein [Bacteroidia bacterium]|jgi:uncharacterized membrane protein YjfL (UPF0719 family)